MNKRSTIAIIAAAFLLTLPALTSAAVYKWTDAEGNTHFSDQPSDVPAGAARIELPAAGSTSPEPAQSQAPSPDEASQEQPALQPDAKAQREIREKNCAIARKTFEHNERLSRMYRVEKDGARVYLNDEERAEVVRRSKEDVSKWCD
ncbi:MAG: DUF4124 domain-containing protein [Chromatiales bacterium]|jgi:hypothetical protein|nr:DUF4124 domain-containing protein [Chromatiales bacterium]